MTQFGGELMVDLNKCMLTVCHLGFRSRPTSVYVRGENMLSTSVCSSLARKYCNY